MVKSISCVLSTLAIVGAVSTIVQASSYMPKGSWPYSQYTTTQPPPSLTSTTTTTTSAPPASEFISPSRNLNRYVIITDPRTGSVIYIPAEEFWSRFGNGNSIRRKRSTWRNSRAFQAQEPRLHLDEVRQIDDVIENDEYDTKYSDYLRSASQYQPQVYYDDNIADSAEDQEFQVEVNHKDNPTWQPSDVFKAFFPNYRYNPNKIIYTYSSLCANGCVNNKKFYNPPADNIVLSSSTSTSTSTETPTSTTTSEAPIIEDAPTTQSTEIEPETTTNPSQTADYDNQEIVDVAPA